MNPTLDEKMDDKNDIEIVTITSPEDRLEVWNNAQRAQYAIYAFWVVMGLGLLGIASDYLEIQLLHEGLNGKGITTEAATINDDRQRIIGIVQLGATIVTAVLFLNWFRRAYGNLNRVKMSTENSEVAAAWSFFIPIIAFFRPPQIMYEIWNKTQLKIKQFDSSYVINQRNYVIILWWILFLISHFIGKYVLKSAFDDHPSFEDILSMSQATMAIDIMNVIEAALMLVILHSISDMETQLGEEVVRSGGTVIAKS